jgi:glycosyltransferase involved in cell wall biosynthesis
MSRIVTEPAGSRPPRASRRVIRASSAPPRVLFLISDLRMGGAERAFVDLANYLRHMNAGVVLIDPAGGTLLDELGGELALFSLHKHDPKPISPTELRTVATVALRRPRGRPRGQMLFELPELLQKTRRLARLVRATDADVVYTFLNRSHTIALLAKFLLSPRIRLVINVHEVLSDSLERHFAPVERWFMRAFIKKGFSRARRVIAVSSGVRNDLVSQFLIPSDRIAVVPDPIDVARIRKASEERVEDCARGPASALIVGVGRLVRLKGFDVLIRAFAQLPEAVLPTLLIVGDGEERPALERLVAELEVADRVEFVGAQANPWKYMGRATVIALPSRVDAFPNVIGEAFALSVPVVATLCSEGVAEYLEWGRCGVLVPPDDVGALAEALERVLTNDELRRRLAQNGASRVEAFDLPRVARQYERLIAEAARG